MSLSLKPSADGLSAVIQVGGVDKLTIKSDGTLEVAATSTQALGVPAYGSLIFTKEFKSAEQTITAAGSLTVAHGLGRTPKLIKYTLVCKVAEHGFSVGDEVDWGTVQYNAASAEVRSGFVNTPDTTNMNIRFGSGTSTFYVLNKSTGIPAAITTSSWRLVMEAFA